MVGPSPACAVGSPMTSRAAGWHGRGDKHLQGLSRLVLIIIREQDRNHQAGSTRNWLAQDTGLHSSALVFPQCHVQREGLLKLL